MRSAVRQPSGSHVPMSWKARGVVVLSLLLGWSWLLVNLPGRMVALYDARRGHAKYGKLYNLAGDAHAAFGREVFAAENVSALTGIPVGALKADGYCATAWTDQQQVLLHDGWLLRQTSAVGWLNVTMGATSVTGRYGMALEPGQCRALHSSECTRVVDLRLVEKHLPSPSTDDWQPILPGQCVLGQIPRAEPAVLGRYTIDLPADKDVTVFVYALPATWIVEALLFQDGQAVERLPGERMMFRTKAGGKHLLTLSSTADGELSAGQGEYSLQVLWGRAVGKHCPIPSFDRRDCYPAAVTGRGR